MAHNCSSIMAEIDRLLEEKKNFDWGGQRPGPSNPLWKEWTLLQRKVTEAERRLHQCVNQPHPPVTPTAIKLSVHGIQCFEQEDTNVWLWDVEDDEPYVLVFSLNVPMIEASLSPPRLDISLPRPKVTKVGPWEDIDDDEITHLAPTNVIWDANNGLITSPNDAFFIVALVENDNSDPEVVRTVTEDLMFGELIKHATSASNRTDFARRLTDAMSGNVGIATTMIGSGFVVDPDDRIGPAQELRLMQSDLNRVFSGGMSMLSLYFAGDDARYRVTFRLSRA